MKKLVILLLATVMVLSLSNIGFAQSAKEAVRALQKLQARVESGISYRDYGSALGDAAFEVKLFLQTSEAKDKPELARPIALTLEHYKMAGSVWDFKVNSGRWRIYGKRAIYFFLNDERGTIEALSRAYPGIVERVTQRVGELFPNQRGKTLQTLPIDMFVEEIWKEASNELEKAIKLLNQ